MKIYIDKDERYPDYTPYGDRRHTGMVELDVPADKVNYWNRIWIEYDAMQRDLDDLYKAATQNGK